MKKKEEEEGRGRKRKGKRRERRERMLTGQQMAFVQPLTIDRFLSFASKQIMQETFVSEFVLFLVER